MWIKIKTLSLLLHHGNRYHKHENFYRIKTIILKKYATLIGYEHQYIEGKKCWTCEGTGIYHKYYFYDKRPTREPCYHCCGTGMYGREHWNALAVYKFGKYTFHSPIGRSYTAPEVGSKIFEGYISHNSSYWSRFSQIAIMILFDYKGYRKTWRTSLGWGLRQWSFRPCTILNNTAYYIKNPDRILPKIKIFRENNQDLPF